LEHLIFYSINQSHRFNVPLFAFLFNNFTVA